MVAVKACLTLTSIYGYTSKMKNLTISRLLLVFLSLISLSILIFIWMTVPDDIEIGGLIYWSVEAYLSQALCFVVVIVYKILTKAFKFPQVSWKWFIIFPIIPNLIVGHWFVVFPILYDLQYSGFNPQAQLISEDLVEDYSVFNEPTIKYEYSLKFSNTIPLEYKNTELVMELAFLGDANPNTVDFSRQSGSGIGSIFTNLLAKVFFGNAYPKVGNYPELAGSIDHLDFTDGKAELSGTLPISLFDLHCRNYNFSKKLKLVYYFMNPPRKKKTLEISPDVEEKIKQAYSTLLAKDAYAGKTNQVLPECPEWTKIFSQ